MAKTQKRDTKRISVLKDLTYIERLKKLKLPSLADRRRRGNMIQTFKIIKRIEDIPSESFLKVCTSSSTCGHSLLRKLVEEQQYEFSQRIINEWNSLPEGVVLAKDVNEFRSKIDHS